MRVDEKSRPTEAGHEEVEEEHHHDAPMDDAKLDSMLWELMKFCIPIGFILWLSIYLMYRNQLSKWSERVPGSASGGGAPAGPVVGGRPTVNGDSMDLDLGKAAKVAWQYVVRNIGSAVGARDGAVVASPSWGEWEDEPDYYYTWTRDAALTMLTISSRFLPSCYLKPWLYNQSSSHLHLLETAEGGKAESKDGLIEPLVRHYIAFQQQLQSTPSRSGDLWSGGLNEPKFHVDGSAFEGDWGRPQRDGPALRALAIIPYAHYLLDRAWPSDILYVRDNLYDPGHIREQGKVIKNDLEEVAGGWWAGGFDLWEEVNGHHLFTLLASLRALQAGAILADRLGNTGAADYYRIQAGKISVRLRDFKDPDGIWRASISDTWEADDERAGGDGRAGWFMPLERSGLDCAVPVAAIHLGHSRGGLGEGGRVEDEPEDDLGPADPAIIQTLHAYIQSFGGLYRINDYKKWTEGWGVGRYAEDVYNGVGTSKGNPWFICTYTVAHHLYLIASHLASNRSVQVTAGSAAFWSDVLGGPIGDNASIPGLSGTHTVDKGVGRYQRFWRARAGAGAAAETQGEKAIRRLIEVGDAYMRVGGRYAGKEGRMSEQFHRSDGGQTGARDLTWSYASFLDALDARKEAYGAAWGL